MRSDGGDSGCPRSHGAGCAESYTLRLRRTDVPRVDVFSLAVNTAAEVEFFAERVAGHPDATILGAPKPRQDRGGGFGSTFFAAAG